MADTQPDDDVCRCGGHRIIRPTASPWEFEATCPRCGRHRISWAHDREPPRYVVTHTAGLFDA